MPETWQVAWQARWQVLWQVLWQTSDVQLSHRVRKNPAFQFDAGRNVSALKMQRHFHMKFLSRFDALEIKMHDQVPMRVHLDLAENHLLRSAFGLQIDNRRVKGLFRQIVHHLIVIQHQTFIVFPRAIDDGRHEIVHALAPTGAGPMVIPSPGAKFIVTAHYQISINLAHHAPN